MTGNTQEPKGKIRFCLLSYRHLDENRTRFAVLEIGKFTLLEIIFDKSKQGIDLEINA